MIISPCQNLYRDAVVATLIDADRVAWNHQAIDATFLAFEACKIKSIPICSLQQADCLCWPWDKSGDYTVKTGYKLLSDEEGRDSVSTSNSEFVVKFWNSLWKLNIAGKIKHFLWRACIDALSTKTYLFKRKIITNALCTACSKEPETVVHALWSCEAAQVVWQKYFGWITMGMGREWSFSDLLDKVMSQPHMLCLFAVTAWMIWDRRNKLAWGRC